MIKAIALDDEPLGLEIIKAFCKQVDYVTLERVFTEASAAIKYMEECPVDLLFLDINMPAISGIDFYKRLSGNTMVIFTTAYSEYAVEGFNLNAVDYLLKPFSNARFVQAVEKARELYNYNNNKDNTPTQYLFVKVDYSMVKVPINDILYIEGLDNYLKIHFDKEKPLLVRMSMKAVIEKLGQDFMRVHRSYIIAQKKVKSVRNKVIYMNNNVEIPVGTNYVDDASKLFKDAG